MSQAPRIRLATEGDLPEILAIYNQVVATSTAIYSDAPYTLEDRRNWMQDRVAKGYPVLVSEDMSGVTGLATFGDFRSFPGYRYSVEHSVHVREDQRGKGLGGLLIEALFPYARALGKHVMIGAIDATNAGSIRFHEKLGFVAAAAMPQVGRKFGRWLDLVFMQRYVDAKDAPRAD